MAKNADLPKKAAAKKPAAAKKAVAPAAKRKTVEESARPVVRRAPVIVKSQQWQPVEIDNSKAVAAAASIAELMRQRAAETDARLAQESIRLSRRPTTRTAGKSSNKFPASDLKEFRRRLLVARETAVGGVDAMKATGFNESDDHEADGGDGTNQTLRLQALGQMGSINRTIQQIDEALHRIDDGTYGVCTVCGQLIRKPRLMNQPFVLTCMECQSEMERGTLA